MTSVVVGKKVVWHLYQLNFLIIVEYDVVPNIVHHFYLKKNKFELKLLVCLYIPPI